MPSSSSTEYVEATSSNDTVNRRERVEARANSSREVSKKIKTREFAGGREGGKTRKTEDRTRTGEKGDAGPYAKAEARYGAPGLARARALGRAFRLGLACLRLPLEGSKKGGREGATDASQGYYIR